MGRRKCLLNGKWKTCIFSLHLLPAELRTTTEDCLKQQTLDETPQKCNIIRRDARLWRHTLHDGGSHPCKDHLPSAIHFQQKYWRKVTMLQHHKWFILLLWQVSVTRVTTGKDIHFTEFINEVEHLVLNTTDEALRMTTIIYQNLTVTMPAQLREATKPIMENYLEMVNNTLQHNNYEEKRTLLKYFRISNWKIERLRLKLAPDMATFQFQVISKKFYFGGHNTTIFDNLYLEFMEKFQKASQNLWDSLSEEVVETQQELLEILDEISKEVNLAEKDKLYDEFIEMFLFKSERDRLETRELE